MASINSVEHCSCNEHGTQQMTITFHKTFWQKLLKRNPTTKVFIYVNGDWLNKTTRKYVTQEEWFLIESLETELRYDIIDEEGHTKRGRSTRRYSRTQYD